VLGNCSRRRLLPELAIATRCATPSDRVIIDAIIDEVYDGVVAHRGGTAFLADFATELSAWSKEAVLDHATAPEHGWVSLVATVDGHVVGWLLANDRDTVRTVWLCVVTAPARGIGCGGALFDAAMTFTADSTLERFEILALPGDRTTKQRAEELGAKARLLVLSRPIGRTFLLGNDGLAN